MSLVSINNHGVNCIKQRNYCGAIRLLRKALPKGVAQLNQRDPNSCDVNFVEMDPRSLPCHQHGFSLHVPPATSTEESYFFSQGFSLLDIPEAYASDNFTNISIQLSVVVYNLSLAHLLYSLNCKEGTQESHLKQAISLLKNSKSLLECAGFTFCTASGNALADFLVMLTLNNLAYALSQMADYAGATEVTLRLSSFIASVECVTLISHDIEIVKVFLQYKSSLQTNALCLACPSHASAA